MATIRVRKVVELDIDLNAYYGQFPRRLRDEIDEAILALASGKGKREEAPREASRPRAVFVTGDPSQLICRTNKTPTKGMTRLIVSDLDHAHDGPWMIEELRERIRKGFQQRNIEPQPHEVSSMVSALFKGEYVRNA